MYFSYIIYIFIQTLYRVYLFYLVFCGFSGCISFCMPFADSLINLTQQGLEDIKCQEMLRDLNLYSIISLERCNIQLKLVNEINESFDTIIAVQKANDLRFNF